MLRTRAVIWDIRGVAGSPKAKLEISWALGQHFHLGWVVHTQTQKKSGLDASWLSSPDGSNWRALLEFSRGVIRSLAFDYQSRAREVHILKVRRAFDEVRAPHLCKYGLRLLSLVGEVQELPGGYWVLAPFRLIPLFEGTFIFIGALPTEELVARYGAIRYEGLGRIVTPLREGAESTPFQSFESWAGIRPISPTQRIEELRAYHAENARIAIQSEATEYLRISPIAPQIEWVKKPTAIKGDKRFAICRERSAFGVRYFSGTLEAHRLLKESSLPRPLADLLPAIAAESSAPIVIRMALRDNEMVVHTPELLPRSLFRIAMLLSLRRRKAGNATYYAFAPSLGEVLPRVMESVGYKVETVG